MLEGAGMGGGVGYSTFWATSSAMRVHHQYKYCVVRKISCARGGGIHPPRPFPDLRIKRIRPKVENDLLYFIAFWADFDVLAYIVAAVCVVCCYNTTA